MAEQPRRGGAWWRQAARSLAVIVLIPAAFLVLSRYWLIPMCENEDPCTRPTWERDAAVFLYRHAFVCAVAFGVIALILAIVRRYRWTLFFACVCAGSVIVMMGPSYCARCANVDEAFDRMLIGPVLDERNEPRNVARYHDYLRLGRAHRILIRSSHQYPEIEQRRSEPG